MPDTQAVKGRGASKTRKNAIKMAKNKAEGGSLPLKNQLILHVFDKGAITFIELFSMIE